MSDESTHLLDLGGVPAELLGTLALAVHDVLKALPPADLTAATKPLVRFDRRGLASAAALRQVVAVLRRAPDIAAATAAAILERPDIEQRLAAMQADDPAAAVHAAAADDALGDLVAGIWAADPPGGVFTLGLCAAELDVARRVVAERQELDSLRRDLAAGAEAARRRDALVADTERKRADLEMQLRDERAGRRSRDSELTSAAAAHEQRAVELEARLAEERTRSLGLEAQIQRHANRIDELEAQLRSVRAELSAAQATDPALIGRRDDLHSLSEAALRLAAGLRALDSAVHDAPAAHVGGAGGETAERAPAPTRRARPTVPGGLVADSPAGVVALFGATADLVFVVDGYNVSHRAWPEATAMEQRDRLTLMLEQVHRRYGCDVVVCFDGDGRNQLPDRRRTGVRIRFSDADQEADEIVIECVKNYSKRIPVVVASSDAWVRDAAQREGAEVISAATAQALGSAAAKR